MQIEEPIAKRTNGFFPISQDDEWAVLVGGNDLFFCVTVIMCDHFSDIICGRKWR